jgi:hypothetical protein
MKGWSIQIVNILLLLGVLMLAGCKSKTAAREDAKSGAIYGTLGGAVSGFFWGLFSGDPLESAAKGAVVGGATGAAMGGAHGWSKDRNLKKEYGEINYNAIMALVQRDYVSAKKFATQGENDSNPKYKKAAVWILALIAKETLGNDALEPYYKKLIEMNEDIETREDARVELRFAQEKLNTLRKQLNER